MHNRRVDCFREDLEFNFRPVIVVTDQEEFDAIFSASLTSSTMCYNAECFHAGFELYSRFGPLCDFRAE